MGSKIQTYPCRSSDRKSTRQMDELVATVTRAVRQTSRARASEPAGPSTGSGNSAACASMPMARACSSAWHAPRSSGSSSPSARSAMVRDCSCSPVSSGKRMANCCWCPGPPGISPMRRCSSSTAASIAVACSRTRSCSTPAWTSSRGCRCRGICSRAIASISSALRGAEESSESSLSIDLRYARNPSRLPADRTTSMASTMATPSSILRRMVRVNSTATSLWCARVLRGSPPGW